MFGLPEHVFGDVLAVLIFGIPGILLLTVGTMLCDWGWKKLDLQGEVQKENISAGIVMAAVVIGLAVIISSTIRAVVGG